MKKLLILAALIAAPLAAQAETATPQPIQISMDGLDLSNPQDAAVLIQRIETAVRPICIAPGVAMRTTTTGCIRKVTRQTIENLGVPEVSLAFKQGRKAPAQFAGR